MPVHASVQLRAIAVQLKAAGDRENRLALSRGLRTAAAPLIVAVKDAAREKLPHGGGLNEQVAGQRVSVSVRTGAKTAGVRLVTRAPDTSQTDSGFVRHPVFNQRNAEGRRIFKRQEIPGAAGWWSATIPAHAGEVTADLLRELERVAKLIQGRR